MFNEFKDEKANFKKALVRDVRGMLGLYEAVHLRVNGEDILDESIKCPIIFKYGTFYAFIM